MATLCPNGTALLGVAPKNSEVEMTCAVAGKEAQAASSSAAPRMCVFMVRQSQGSCGADARFNPFSGDPACGVTPWADFFAPGYFDSICPGTSSPPVAASSSSRATAQQAIALTNMRKPQRTKCSFASSTRLLV